MFFRQIILAAACALCAVPAANAAPKAPKAPPSVIEAEQMATRAAALFKAKDFALAAELFLKAHIALRTEGIERPIVLFNAGRAYQEAGNKAEARAQLRLVMLMEGADAETRAAAQQILDQIEREMRAATPLPVVVMPEKPTTAPAPVTTPTTRLDTSISPIGVKKQAPTPAPATRPHEFPLAKGGLALGLGLASFGTWVFAYSQAENARAINPREEADITRYGELQQSAELWQIGAIVLGVASGAAAVWTATDYYWFTPTISARLAGGGSSVVGVQVGTEF